MKYFFFISFCFFFISCSLFRQDGELVGVSKRPGKKILYIDSKKLPNELKELVGEFAFIPTQTIVLNNYADSYYEGANKVSVDPFFMSVYEVTNKQYRRFCKEAGREYLPDTLVWRRALAFNDPYVEYYFRHEAYDDHPVVGVTYENALAYCEWLTGKVKDILEKYPKIEWRLTLGDFRLPTEAEWVCAAKGGNELNLFPFGNELLYVDKKKNIRYYENFKGLTDNNLTILGLPKTDYLITSPVGAFMPNDYGLFDMGGNVSEWTRTIAYREYVQGENPSDTPDPEKDQYVFKGGSWLDGHHWMQVNVRRKGKKDYRSDALGFRVMMSFRMYDAAVNF